MQTHYGRTNHPLCGQPQYLNAAPHICTALIHWIWIGYQPAQKLLALTTRHLAMWLLLRFDTGSGISDYCSPHVAYHPFCGILLVHTCFLLAMFVARNTQLAQISTKKKSPKRRFLRLCLWLRLCPHLPVVAILCLSLSICTSSVPHLYLICFSQQCPTCSELV